MHISTAISYSCDDAATVRPLPQTRSRKLCPCAERSSLYPAARFASSLTPSPASSLASSTTASSTASSTDIRVSTLERVVDDFLRGNFFGCGAFSHRRPSVSSKPAPKSREDEEDARDSAAERKSGLITASEIPFSNTRRRASNDDSFLDDALAAAKNDDGVPTSDRNTQKTKISSSTTNDDGGDVGVHPVQSLKLFSLQLLFLLSSILVSAQKTPASSNGGKTNKSLSSSRKNSMVRNWIFYLCFAFSPLSVQSFPLPGRYLLRKGGGGSRKLR